MLPSSFRKRFTTRGADTTTTGSTRDHARGLFIATPLRMTNLLGFLFVGGILNTTTTDTQGAQGMSFAPVTDKYSHFLHEATRERVSCNRWLNLHKQHSNIVYLFATAASLENQALHLKLRYLDERVGDEQVARRWESIEGRDFMAGRNHTNFPTQLHHLIADMRIMDQDLNRIFIPNLKRAEVGEADASRSRSYVEAYKNLIYHSFELRCKLNYWIKKKHTWLKQHHGNTTHQEEDDEDEDEVGYYDLLVALESNNGPYRRGEMREESRHLRDFTTLNDLVKQLNWFINQSYLTRLVEHLYPKRDLTVPQRRRLGDLSTIKRNSLRRLRSKRRFRKKRL